MKTKKIFLIITLGLVIFLFAPMDRASALCFTCKSSTQCNDSSCIDGVNSINDDAAIDFCLTVCPGCTPSSDPCPVKQVTRYCMINERCEPFQASSNADADSKCKAICDKIGTTYGFKPTRCYWNSDTCTAPPPPATKYPYHCTVVGKDPGGKVEAGKCKDLSSTRSDAITDPNENAVLSQQCASSINDWGKVKIESGDCAAVKSSPLAGTSAVELQRKAKDLNKLRITDIPQLIGRFINLLTAFIGSIALVLYIYSGFLWMTASGNTEQVGKAKTTMVWTTLGVAMMLASYMLASFIFKSLGV